MHLLPEKYFDNKDTQNNRKEKSSNFGRRLFLVSLLVGFILIVVAVYCCIPPLPMGKWFLTVMRFKQK